MKKLNWINSWNSNAKKNLAVVGAFSLLNGIVVEKVRKIL